MCTATTAGCSLPGTPPAYFFFFNDPATTEIYTLSLHAALPICCRVLCLLDGEHEAEGAAQEDDEPQPAAQRARDARRSEEHTSELQSQSNIVCRLLLEKKKSSSSGHSIALSAARMVSTSSR